MSGQSNNAPKWSAEQLDAIQSSGSNILVAAAAGSGKTAVLVERIIRKISTQTDVDRLLVATFTNAAAAEMKDRIKVALERKLEEQPDSEHLRKQLALMGKASITTLHSFCMEVVRKYYSTIGLDPGFRIGNETEIELIRNDVLMELFEHRYEHAEQYVDFIALVNAFGGQQGDEPLLKLVERLYLFSRSHPWPEAWLEQMANAFNIGDVDELEQSSWVKQLMADVELKLEGAIASFQQGLELTRLPSGPYAYASTFEEDIEIVRRLSYELKSLPWRDWGQRFSSVAFPKLATLRGKDHDKDLQKLAQEFRNSGKETILDIASDYFGRTPQQYMAELHSLAPLMKELVSLINDFAASFQRIKTSKGLLDFGDLEHYCLAILLDPSSTPEQLIPSDAARSYQRQFDEILLDEYQDTNLVQETIVSLISNNTQGNRFMVGDVKQSIYRFRLAEPGLFLQKYKTYSKGEAATGSMNNAANDGANYGKRIDLARNFRSRSEVVDAVNIVFQAIMKEKVAELEYDKAAELVHGAVYFPPPESLQGCRVECIVINQEENEQVREYDAQDDGSDSEVHVNLQQDLKAAQLEARYVTRQLLAMKQSGALVYDAKQERYRPIEWRDSVILLRSTSAMAPVFLDELQLAGIPAYSSIGTGYFEAVEVQTMLSVLQIIDNPFQDIPLAAVLRSPLFKLTAEELSHIRILSMDSSYYEAVVYAAGNEQFSYEGRVKLAYFLDKLDEWRNYAREGALADLLWLIYEQTGYYDFVGGLPGGIQRQANLRALHDRARQYEATSFRGLFRFLKFIERMRENGKDLGTALAIGEGEDVVRIMTIHASKGLEFPIVFLAGLGKKFNDQDIRSSFLYHKELGFGPKVIDLQLRTSYPSLPFIAIRRAIKMELLAEEMRILYVALTRPKEKLILVGTANKLSSKLLRWGLAQQEDGTLTLSGIAGASSYLDWIAPLVSKSLEQSLQAHQQALESQQEQQAQLAQEDQEDQRLQSQQEQHERHQQDQFTKRDLAQARRCHSPIGWIVEVQPAQELSVEQAEQAPTADEQQERAERLMAIEALAQIENIERDEQLHEQLEFNYPYSDAVTLGAKASITEMKRIQGAFEEEEANPLFGSRTEGMTANSDNYDYEGDFVAESANETVHEEDRFNSTEGASWQEDANFTMHLQRPSFMEQKGITPTERGSINHLVMQHLPLDEIVDREVILSTIDHMVAVKLINAEQATAINVKGILGLFQSELGYRMGASAWIKRELPFAFMLPASEVYRDVVSHTAEEPIFIQGVIDCLFEDSQGLVLVDYKTDRIYQSNWEEKAEQHRFQLEMYARGLEMILQRKVDEIYVFFFDGGVSVRL